MEIEKLHKIRDDRMGVCRSFGSNYKPCSQSRKISIGIMVDSTLKANPGATREKEVTVANAEKVNLSNDKCVEGKRLSQGISTSVRGKQTVFPQEPGSPGIRSVSPTVKTVHHAKPNLNFPTNSGEQNKFNNEKGLTNVHLSQFVEKDAFNLQVGEGKQNKSVRFTYSRRGRGDKTANVVEDLTSSPVTNVLGMEDKINKSEITSSVVLETKLSEILGAISSPDKKQSDSKILDTNFNISNLRKVCAAKDDTIFKSRQKYDTIEPDFEDVEHTISIIESDSEDVEHTISINETYSEDVEHTIRRPVTRSVTRKRAPSVQPLITRIGTSFRHKQNNEEENIFQFQEGLSENMPAANGGSSLSKMKSKRKSSQIDTRKTSFTDRYNAERYPKITDDKKRSLSSGETSSLGSRLKGLYAFPSQVDKECIKVKNAIPKRGFKESSVVKDTVKIRDLDSPALSENADQHEDDHNLSLNNIVDKQDVLHSLKFGKKSATKQNSPSSPPIADPIDINCSNPASANKIFSMGNICSFKSWQTSKPDLSPSKAQTDSFDDEEELNDSPTRTAGPYMEEKNGGLSLSKSPSQERDYASVEDDSPINGGYNSCTEDEPLSPKIGIAERQQNNNHSAKRIRGHADITFNKFNPISPSLQGSDEDNGLCKPSEDDGLSRAVTLFALALERLQRKVKSVTEKKTSEILMSAADGISLQMQNVESQIQADIGKLTGLSKSTRKHLEIRFQEHQEKLKVIHKNFIKEVNQHLQNCSSTLEEVEANKINLKGTIEKQKASHQKVLLQVEEAIESQLSDAERRITGVHKLANERMLELKQVISECFMEGMLD